MSQNYCAVAGFLSLLISITTVSGELVAINNLKINAKTFYTDTDESAIMTWTEAMDFCQRLNMTPGRIDSLEENNLVSNFLNTTFRTNKWFWLGATDYGSETRHYWIPSGDELTYENWTSPSQTEYRTHYNCVSLEALSGGRWFSQYCRIEDNYWKPRPLCHIDSTGQRNKKLM